MDFLDSDEGPDVERTNDGFGFTWLVVRTEPAGAQADMGSLCTDLHAVNSALQDDGFARGLLCSVFGFRTASAQPLGHRLPLHHRQLLSLRPHRQPPA